MSGLQQDQAAGLRRLHQAARPRILPVFGTAARVQAVINLAAAAARSGSRVLVIDAARGEVAPAAGLAARYELIHVLEGEKDFAGAALHAADGLRVLPAARGLHRLAMDGHSGLDVFEQLAVAAAPVDLIIVNAEPGLAASLLRLPGAAEALLVCTAAEASAEAALFKVKALSAACGLSRFRLFALDTSPPELAALAGRLDALSRKRCGAAIAAGAAIPPDPALRHALAARRTIFEIDDSAAAARAYAFAASLLPQWPLASLAVTAKPPAHHALAQDA